MISRFAQVFYWTVRGVGGLISWILIGFAGYEYLYGDGESKWSNIIPMIISSIIIPLIFNAIAWAVRYILVGKWWEVSEQ